MAKCQYPACPRQTAAGARCCEKHQATANIALPATPMSVQVMQAREWDRLEAEMVTRERRAALAPPPRALATVPPTPVAPRRPVSHVRHPAATGPALARTAATERVAEDQARNVERMRVSYAALLAARKTDAELLRPSKEALWAIKGTPRFKHYHEAETAWLNRSAIGGRILRAAAPAMIMRPIAEEVRDRLRAMSLNFMTADKAFAERYFFELSLYCDAVITKQDISFIFSQASVVLGPVLGPALSPVTGAVHASGAAAGSSTAASVGLGRVAHAAGERAGAAAASAVAAAPRVVAKKVAEKVVVPTGTYATIPVNDYRSNHGGLIGFVSNATSSEADPMRFTLAWLNFVTKETEPAAPIATLIREFGGMAACVNLLVWLTSSNL